MSDPDRKPPGEQTNVPAAPILAVLAGQIVDPPPLWLMRQAGRYLPEYRSLREKAGGFLAMVYRPELAAEITLQPLRRFGMDAAILFSDILVVPHAMGQHLEFLAGEGPRLSPRLADAMLETLEPSPDRFAPVYETVRRVRTALAPEQALIGFAGSPWTVATYMVNGEGSRDQHAARLMAYRDPARFGAIIEAISEATIGYLEGQAEAGAQALQLFDSWSGALAPTEFGRWVIGPTARIVARLKARWPQLPVIGFPKGAGTMLSRYAVETGVDAVGVDETLDPDWVHRNLPAGLPVQGNLDPVLLEAGGDALDEAVLRIRSAFRARPHVFNLGHGIGQHTPIDHVERLLRVVRTPLS